MGAVRAIGIFLALSACGLTVYSLWTPFWATNIQNMGGFNAGDVKALGLWQYCSKGSSDGNFRCQPLKQLGVQRLAQMGIVGFRAFMIIGLIAGVGGFCAGVTSTDTVNIAKSDKDKNKAAGGAAGCFVVAGLCVLAATSWAAHNIIRVYQKYSWNLNGSLAGAGTQWTLGAGIYAGWVAAAIFLGVSVIMFLGCCSGSEDDYEDTQYQQAHPHQYAESGYAHSKKEFV